VKFRAGDLCIVVSGDCYPETIGRVLTLTAPCAVWPDSWDTDPPVFIRDRRLPMSFWEPTLRLVRGDDVGISEEAPVRAPEPAEVA
jgi:hypothetical protein